MSEKLTKISSFQNQRDYNKYFTTSERENATQNTENAMEKISLNFFRAGQDIVRYDIGR